MSRPHITRVTLDEAMRTKGETDWARFDAMTGEDIAKAVADDPSLPPLDIDWTKASLVVPATAKDVITLRLDHDVLKWLRSTGKGYQTRINQVLRAWYEATLHDKGMAIQKAAGEKAAAKPKAALTTAAKKAYAVKKRRAERAAKRAQPAKKRA
jgi:uncharacterized protein (DUF4415 family)